MYKSCQANALITKIRQGKLFSDPLEFRFVKVSKGKHFLKTIRYLYVKDVWLAMMIHTPATFRTKLFKIPTSDHTLEYRTSPLVLNTSFCRKNISGFHHFYTLLFGSINLRIDNFFELEIILDDRVSYFCHQLVSFQRVSADCATQ